MSSYVVSVNDFDGNSTLIGPYRSREAAERVQGRLDRDFAAVGAERVYFCTVEPLHPGRAFPADP